MNVIDLLQITAALLTIGTGLLSLWRPRSITNFIGLKPVGGRGVTEIRAIFGATFVALGAYPLFAGNPIAYQMLGAIYLAIAIVRAPSMLLDHSIERSNVISLAVEIVLGIILVW